MENSLKERRLMIIYLICIIPFFIPDIFNYKIPFIVTIFRLAQVGILLLYLIMFIKRGKLSKLIKYLFLYLVFLFFTTYLKNGDIYYSLKNSINVLGLCLVCEFALYENPKIFLKTMLFYLTVLNVINFGTIFVYPEGMYLNNSGMYTNWFLGYKNSHILYILPWLILLILDTLNKNKRIPIYLYLILLFSLAMMIRLEASTSIIALFSLIVCLFFRNKLEKFKLVTGKNLLVISFVLFLLIVIFRVQDIFSFIFVDVLDKTLTFTGRTYIWDNALEKISQSFLFGYGDNSFFYNKYILSTHNQFLGIVYETGIIGLFIYLIIYKCIVKEIDSCKDDHVLFFSKYFIFIYLLMMLMEDYNMRYYMYIFVIIYNLCIMSASKHKELIEVQGES